MENWIVSVAECKLLKSKRSRLQNRYNVKIITPELENRPVDSDKEVICVCIYGESSNINSVKGFIALEMLKRKEMIQSRCTMVDNIPMITLSGSESEVAVTSAASVKRNKKKRKRTTKKAKPCPLPAINCEVSSTIEPNGQVAKKPRTEPPEPMEWSSTECSSSNPGPSYSQGADDSIIVLSITEADERPKPGTSRSLEADDSIIILPHDEVSVIAIHEKEESKKNSSIILLSNEDFIPLYSKNQRKGGRNAKGITVLKEQKAQVSRPLKTPRALRPVVIDGSNVAREHGKIKNSYSCQGIKISVDFFLKRGHTTVTAFVPQFRRHRTFGPIPTTDETILEDLAKKQQVVFTPSRRVDGKLTACYDDRFIVELASQNGGVMLSNDNYKDLIDESPEFKKTIQERLLMFCFVGDILMCPKDPLGRNGPNLDEFLSFPDANKRATVT